MRTRILLKLSLLTPLVVALAYAQTQKPIVTAKIPFAFMVEKKAMPAGQYEFVPNIEREVMRVVDVDKKSETVFATIITRLASGMHTTPEDAHIVFDKVGDVYTLSEIWAVGEDGYLLHSTKGKHEHHIVNVPK